MDKHGAPKKLLNLLPKAVSAVNFYNTPFSPSKDKRSDTVAKLKSHAGKGFSGPVISIIPDEVRRKLPKNGSYEAQEEPTSPKVSCIGQIKQKKKMNKAKQTTSTKAAKPVALSSTPREGKKRASKLKRLFSSAKPSRKSDVSSDDDKLSLPDRAPCLSQMKRFASGRGHNLSGFDWTAQIAPADGDHRGYYSDEERGDNYEEEAEDDDDEVIIPFSAPITVGGGVALQPKKEINIWKRRTMNPPRPLQLNSRARVHS